MQRLSLLLFLLLFGFGSPCFAPWAKHEIFRFKEGGPGNLSLQYKEEGGEKFILVTLDVNKKMDLKHKGFFLITAKEPLPEEELEFRLVMMSWKNEQELRERYKQMVKQGMAETEEELIQKYFSNAVQPDSLVAKIEHIQTIEFVVEEEVQRSVIPLPLDVAQRSYLVYDFKPWGGALVRDGGLWATYDLPSYVKAYLENR